MPSFQISITPSRRAAGRFIGSVRRALQRTLAEEREHTGLTQAEIARRIGVHRSIINRELQGRQDITLGRVAELAWAMGKRATLSLEPAVVRVGQNVIVAPPISTISVTAHPSVVQTETRPSTSTFEAPRYKTVHKSAG